MRQYGRPNLALAGLLVPPGFTFLVPAHPGSPGQSPGAMKWLWCWWWWWCRGKSGLALASIEYWLMPSACQLIVRAYHIIPILRAAVHQYESKL